MEHYHQVIPEKSIDWLKTHILHRTVEIEEVSPPEPLVTKPVPDVAGRDL